MTPQSHILVVDDEHGILQSLKKIYEREDFKVSITDSGEEALEIVRKEKVDLVQHIKKWQILWVYLSIQV